MSVVPREREHGRTRRRIELPTTPPPPSPPPERPRGRVPWSAVAVVALLLAIAVGIDRIGDALPSLDNPFAETTVDRTQPPVLKAIQDIGEYRAASGNYEVIVDLEKDTKLPSELLGERILFVAVGSVDAGVDLSGVGEDAVRVSEDGTAATITLPRARLYEAEIDVGRSYVYERDRGLLDRIGDVFGGDESYEREAYLAAERRLDEAALANGELTERAEENTRTMLASLVRSLGFDRVEIRFE